MDLWFVISIRSHCQFVQVITYSGKWLQCGSTAHWSKAFELWTTQVYILAAIGCAQSIVCQDATNYAGNAHTIIKYTYHLMARVTGLPFGHHIWSFWGKQSILLPASSLPPGRRLGFGCGTLAGALRDKVGGSRGTLPEGLCSMIWKKMKKHEMRRLMFMLLLTGERRNAKNQKKMIMTMAMIVGILRKLANTHTKTSSAWS